ncbi:hypothetical protein QNF12_000142 [Vibrio alginolyticus]|uniref:hypothetical protein n=1 Tax=Vibrio parahaemolyticus TaxID=670 RepID=UPI0005F16E82|nr:hypothetical protein [Vibrio parahaemolyticus]EJG0880634.1 hypothetical protein [Vibrio parahaemolyticus]ELB2747332.1 hypothetical protein [Vibrio alginolyticus]
MRLPILVEEVNGRDFELWATEDQARQILNARIGDRIALEGNSEFLVVHDNFIEHWMKRGGRSSFEHLILNDVKSKIREKLLGCEWEHE